MKNNTRAVVIGVSAIVLTAIFFIVPFVFIFLIASKDVTESAALEFSWPQTSSCSTTSGRPWRPVTT